MAELIAQGATPQDRWRRLVPLNERWTVGRVGAWAVPWDRQVSKAHVELEYRESRLLVRQLSEAKNPVYWQGRAEQVFEVGPGDHFVIGGTTFTLIEVIAEPSLDLPVPLEERAFSPDYLKQLRYRNAEQRIEILVRLPELITAARTDAELFERVVNLLLIGIPRASTVAVVELEPGPLQRPGGIKILHWDRRQVSAATFRPSERLIKEALSRSESLLHIWQSSSGTAAFTMAQDSDWSYCCPIRGSMQHRTAIYVAGKFQGDYLAKTPSESSDLRDDLKFTESLAATVAALRDVRALQNRQAGLSQFFSPLVLEALQAEDPDVALVPREAEVSVLFCDLRGFSRQSETHAGELLALLERVSKALGVTTRHILATGGVVGDFHGDAAMGFWGWPLPQEDAAARACKAALAIRAEFEAAAKRPGDPLSGFRVGLGVATGKAVAGKIGTVDQVKVTVFGPVVNLAARLEGMTKILGGAILLDEQTAARCRQTLAAADGRLRKLAVVRPSGMSNRLTVTELVPPLADIPWFTDEHIAAYERALEQWQAGDWDQAIGSLHHVPAEDRAKDFLTVYIAQHHRVPPPDFDGVIQLSSKS